MSSYYKTTKNPYTGEWEKAQWIDNYFGPRHYGVLFPSGVKVDPEGIELETREEEELTEVIYINMKRKLEIAFYISIFFLTGFVFIGFTLGMNYLSTPEGQLFIKNLLGQ